MKSTTFRAFSVIVKIGIFTDIAICLAYLLNNCTLCGGNLIDHSIRHEL
ncbi:hypothetical protein LCIT_02140 [Leuconostoc citreum]|uniref:Uncharacterized protein n=1 Tax=Leuconostoc citreum TaxID=33964 RepID=A0A5A5TYH1_LEUCI|nr:hypothetical protein LCIT_02140 [Leuconostoc citreum]GDZ85482.1 hypothetical protein LCTS_06810 [Leuconostoc citreum]GEK60884.1 hypothetical protein LCI01_05200 [Leuconostoc citreum]